MQEEPLIWTTKGNLSISQLTYSNEWVDETAYTANLSIQEGDMKCTVDRTGYIKFIERYHLGEELVKESAHVKMFEGTKAVNEQGAIG